MGGGRRWVPGGQWEERGIKEKKPTGSGLIPIVVLMLITPSFTLLDLYHVSS
jgi:hypothetical protein